MRLFLIGIGMATFGCAANDMHDHAPGEGGGEPGQPLGRIEAFHGHVGPYVVIGYRMGLLAREVLGSPGYFDLTARIACPGKPPPSCIIDGLQLGSGCTTGKRNLEVTVADRISCTFETKAGKRVEIGLRDGVPQRIAAMIAEMGVDAAGRAMLTIGAREIFVVGEVQGG